MRWLGLVVWTALAAAVLAPTAADAATLPAGFVEDVVADGLNGATAMAFAPDGRLFVTEQQGTVRVAQGGQTLPDPFLSLTVDGTGERGLLGIAFDPQFQTNGYVYVYYTTSQGGAHNRISRFTATGNVAVPGSEVVLMDLPALAMAANHNGGALHFGPDGMLYAAVGDNANGANSQSLGTVLGKILRLAPDGTIPADNPFVASATGQNDAIWALGLRNPYTFAFQAGTGRMYVNDVGQNTWEEIDEGQAGANYGWPDTEGPTTDPDFLSPVYAYQHDTGSPTGCAITGGAFYNPGQPQFPPAYFGSYFFADFCGGWIYRLDPAAPGAAVPFASAAPAIVDLQVSADGALHYLARDEGRVYRIRFVGDSAPGIVTPPQDVTVTVGDPAAFEVTAYGSAPLGYQWLRDGVDIQGATDPSYTLEATSLADSGAQFALRVTNWMGSVTSAPATLTVSTNHAPTAMISTPAAGASYAAGTTITYAGAGTDPEEGVLPASAFTWRVDFHHDAHTHPFLAAHSGVAGGTFTVPALGETAANVFYRVTLTVVDGEGRTGTTTRDVLPVTAGVAVRTSPPGLSVTLDGQPGTAPIPFTGVAGILRTIGTNTPQASGGRTWRFAGWSDGGALEHQITTPAADASYIAIFHTDSTVCPAAPPVPFADITQSFAADEISCLAALGLTSGTTPATYTPAAPVTRGEMAVFLARFYETLVGPHFGTGLPQFTDVGGHFAAHEIAILGELGVTAGTGGGLYSPDAAVTREEMAVFLVRVWEASGHGALPTGDAFEDTAGSFARDEATALAAAGITAGCAPGKFCPPDPVTREQMAIFLVRLLDAAFVGVET